MGANHCFIFVPDFSYGAEIWKSCFLNLNGLHCPLIVHPLGIEVIYEHQIDTVIQREWLLYNCKEIEITSWHSALKYSLDSFVRNQLNYKINIEYILNTSQCNSIFSPRSVKTCTWVMETSSVISGFSSFLSHFRLHSLGP